MRDLFREAMRAKCGNGRQRWNVGPHLLRSRRRRGPGSEPLEDRTLLSVIGAAGVFVDANNDGFVNDGDIDVTIEASDGTFDTDISEGIYVARNGVGLIVNQDVTAGQIDFRADNLITLNATLTATTDGIHVVSRASEVILLEATLTSDNNDVVVRAPEGIVGNSGALTIVAAGDVELRSAQAGVDVFGAMVTAGDGFRIIGEGMVSVSEAHIEASGAGGFTLRSVSGDVEMHHTTLFSPVGRINIRAGHDVLGNRFFVDGGTADITVNAGRDINIPSTGEFITRSTFATNGNLWMTAGRDIIGPEAVLGGSSSAESQVVLKAVRSVIVPEVTIAAGGELVIRASDGDVDITFSQNMRSFGRIVVEAGHDIHADRTLVVAGPDAEDSATFKAGRDINMTGESALAFGTAHADGDLRLTAGRDINGENQFFTSVLGAVQFRASRTVRAMNSQISAGGTGGVTLQAVNGNVEVPDGEIVTDHGPIRIVAGKDVLGSSVNLIVSGIAALDEITVRAGRDINIATDDGAASVVSVVNAGGDLRMAAGRDINTRFAVLGGLRGAVDLRAGHSLVVAEGTIAAHDAITLRAAQRDVDMTLSTIMSFDAGLTVVAGTDVHGNQSAFDTGPDADDTATIQAGRDIHLAGGGAAASGDLKLIAGRDINSQNQIFLSLLGAVGLRAGGTIRVNGVQTEITAATNVTLRAATGNIEADDASLTAGNNIVLNAAVNVFVNNTRLDFGGMLLLTGTQIGTPIII